MASAEAPVSPDATGSPQGQTASLAQLPGYSRSLLKIELPVSVTLAQKKMPLQNVLELVSGTIIQFDKQYDEPLTLEVAGHQIAEGEAVKVGDKFGIRLTAIVSKRQRIRSVSGRRQDHPSG